MFDVDRSLPNIRRHQELPRNSDDIEPFRRKHEHKTARTMLSDILRTRDR